MQAITSLQEPTPDSHLVQVEGTFHQLRPQGVLLLAGVQLAMAVQEALRKGAKAFQRAK